MSQQQDKDKRKEKIKAIVLSLNELFPTISLETLHQVVLDCKLDEALAIETVIQMCEENGDLLGEPLSGDGDEEEEETSECGCDHHHDEEENIDDEEQEIEYNEEEEIYFDEEQAEEVAGESGFEEVVKTKEFKTRGELYTVLDMRELLKDQEAEVKKVAETLGLKSKVFVECMLKEYQWNTEKLIIDYGDMGLDSLLRKCGLNPDFKKSNSTSTIGTCDACYSDDVELFAYDMCGHVFCRTCWKEYIVNHVQTAMNDNTVKCMDYSCKTTLTETFMLSQLDPKEDKELFDKFFQRKVDSYVGSSFRLKWCPNPNCHGPFAIKKLCDENLYIAVCKCGEEFCFHCDKDPHYPCSCAVFKRFLTIAEDDFASKEFIHRTSQQCRRCKRIIFKDVGCNHINCVCGFEFCYICGSEYTSYVHADTVCAPKKTETSEEIKLFTAAEELYGRFVSLYRRHTEWLAEHRQTGHYRIEIANYKEKNFHCRPTKDIKFMSDSFKNICRCRRLLRSCYAFAYIHFGFDTLILKSNTTTKGQKEFLMLETYGYLFNDHLARLEEYVSDLLLNLDAILNLNLNERSFRDRIKAMEGKAHLITKSQKNIIDFINTSFDMKEISYK